MTDSKVLHGALNAASHIEDALIHAEDVTTDELAAIIQRESGLEAAEKALDELCTAVHLTPEANRILGKELVQAEAALRQIRGETK